MPPKLKKLQEILRREGLSGVIQRLYRRLCSPTYSQWLRHNQPPIQSSNLPNGPKISFLVPVDDLDISELTTSIQSVCAQTYPNWQLCIGTSSLIKTEAIRSTLEHYTRQDDRIQVASSPKKESTAAVLNATLAVAEGEFVALLHSEDQLAPNALQEVALCLRQHPETDFIYTDEDQITLKGKRKRPFFKPDWSPDYCHACMYTGHLSIYRTRLVQKIGGFRSEYDGAWEWDLVLRLSEQTSRIRHIPKVLYHRRTQSSSLALSLPRNPNAQAAQRALQDMLDRSPYPGWVEPGPTSHTFHVRRQIKGNPLVSIIIPSAGTRLRINFRNVCLLEQCLQSVRRVSTYRNIEIIVVDGYDIPKSTLEKIQSLDIRLVRCDQPFNFSQRMNLGAAAAVGDIFLMLNDDIKVITPNWIEALLELAQQEEIAAVGAKLLFPTGRIQHAGVLILKGGPDHAFYNQSQRNAGDHYSNWVNRNYLAVTGACLMMRRSVFEELEGFDEGFPLNYNDVDLCLRAHQAGYRNVFTPHAQLVHYESVSRERVVQPVELERLHARYQDTEYMARDPYYNSNLVGIRFRLPWPEEES